MMARQRPFSLWIRLCCRVLALSLLLIVSCHGWLLRKFIRCSNHYHGLSTSTNAYSNDPSLSSYNPGKTFQEGSEKHATFPESLSIGYVSIAGEDPDRHKVNQDASFCCYHKSDDQNVTILGVMDGHGTKGHELVSYLKEQLPRRILQVLCSPETVTEADLARLKQLEDRIIKVGRAKSFSVNASSSLMLFQSKKQGNNKRVDGDDAYYSSVLTNAFHLAHLDAQMEPGVPAQRSGTTVVVALLVSTDGTSKTKYRSTPFGRMHLAHVGDSQALWGKANADTSNNHQVADTLINNTTKGLFFETIATNTQSKVERERVQECKDVNSGVRIDDQGNVFYGPQGIAMTRSLGNAVMLPAGILPTPVIESVDCPDWLVLMTDGISGVMSPEQAQNILESAGHHSMQEAVLRLATEAREAWRNGLAMEVKIDDITCVAASCIKRK